MRKGVRHVAVTVSKKGSGAHFEPKRSTVVDVLCGVGCVAFALTASGTLVAGTMSTLARGTDMLTAATGTSGTVVQNESGADTSGGGGTSKTPSGDKGGNTAGAPVGEKDDEKSSGEKAEEKAEKTEEKVEDAPAADAGTEGDDAAAETPAETPAAPQDPSAAPVETQPTQSAPQVRTEPVIHLISWGETLSGISARYGVSIDAIAIANQIRDVNLIYAGSALVIPAA